MVDSLQRQGYTVLFAWDDFGEYHPRANMKPNNQSTCTTSTARSRTSS